MLVCPDLTNPVKFFTTTTNMIIMVINESMMRGKWVVMFIAFPIAALINNLSETTKLMN